MSSSSWRSSLQRIQVVFHAVQAVFDQFVADAQGIEQFEAETAVIIQRVVNKLFQRLKAAERPELRLARFGFFAPVWRTRQKRPQSHPPNYAPNR